MAIKRPRTKALSPLGAASERLELLEQSGLSRKRRAELAAKSVAELEAMLGNPDVDPFARIAAAKTILRDVCGIQPGKATAQVHGSQAPVVINIGDMPPAPARLPKNVTPQPAAAQAPVVIDA